MYLLAAGLYLVVFTKSTSEARALAPFAIGAAVVLLQSARLAPGGWAFRSMVVVLLAISSLTNCLFLLQEPGSDTNPDSFGTPRNV